MTSSETPANDGETVAVTTWLEAKLGGRVRFIRRQTRWRPVWLVDLESDHQLLELMVRGDRTDTEYTWSLHHEMEFLVESGMTPAEVLSAATSSNAQILKENDNLGSIEPGKLADLVVLEANPLEDITNTRKIHRVIKGGKLLVPEVILRNAPQQ